MSVLETKEVFYSYAKGNRVLSGVSAVFETGLMYAIVGPSGSGKSTLLYACLLYTSPSPRDTR